MGQHDKEKYTIHFEPMAEVVRVFKAGMVPGKDPYFWAASVCYRNFGKTAEIKGFSSINRRTLISLRDTFFRAFLEKGVSKVIWERKLKSGVAVEREVDLITGQLKTAVVEALDEDIDPTQSVFYLPPESRQTA